MAVRCQCGSDSVTEGLKGAGHCQSSSALMSWLIFPNVTRSMGEGLLLYMTVLTEGLRQELVCGEGGCSCGVRCVC